MIELRFKLKQVDDWPPIGIEALWCEENDDGLFRVKVAPFFVKGLSVDDLISIHSNSSGEVVSWEVVNKSPRSVVWIVVKQGKSIESELSKLKNWGCNVEELSHYSLYSIDIPPSCSASQFDPLLDSIEDEKAFIAFPSFRHDQKNPM